MRAIAILALCLFITGPLTAPESPAPSPEPAASPPPVVEDAPNPRASWTGTQTLHVYVMPPRHFDLQHPSGASDAGVVGVYHHETGLIEMAAYVWPSNYDALPVSGNYTLEEVYDAMDYWPDQGYAGPGLPVLAHEVWCHAWNDTREHTKTGLCAPGINPTTEELFRVLEAIPERYGYVNATLYAWDAPGHGHAWDRRPAGGAPKIE